MSKDAHKDVQRNCNRCGMAWFVPKRQSRERAPGRVEMAGRRMQAAGSSASLFSSRRTSDQLRLANAEAKLERVLRNGRCPSCGSSEYTWGAPAAVTSAKIDGQPTQSTSAAASAAAARPRVAKGVNGTVTVEGDSISIRRTAGARAGGLTDRVIPLNTVVAVRLTPPRGVRGGHLRFLLFGDQEAPVDPRKDDNGVVFVKTRKMAVDFQAVFEHVQARITERVAARPAEAGGEPVPAGIASAESNMNAHEDGRPALVVERMRQLAHLRDLGLVSLEEYEAKRTELLGNL